LGRLDSPLAIWCCLYAEIVENPRDMNASEVVAASVLWKRARVTMGSRARMDLTRETKKAKSRYFKD
jgi:hypothetical protein